MTTLRPTHILVLLALHLVPSGSSSAQCTNTAPYPSASITPNGAGAVTIIDPCNWQTEYSTIIGIEAGASYEFTYEGGAWVTVRQGTYNGAVLGYGVSPLTVEAATAQNLYVHWNTDSLCGTAQECHATTVQRLGVGCTPPEVTTEVVPDCENDQFTVAVNVANTGDATSIGLSWTVNGGAPNNLAGLQAGSYQLGPFANGSLIDLTVVHAEEPACNVVVNDLTNEPCLTQSCGPDTYTYCYGNNENYVQTYQGNSTWPLQLTFNSGSVSGSGNDALVIHDGLLGTDPVLFSGIGNGGNLAGVTVISTNPDHALTITFTSNSSFSCVDAGGSLPPWNYTVLCLDCEPATVEAGEVTTDCDGQEFTVAVAVSDMGTSTSAAISNNAGLPPTEVTGIGTYITGPFPVGTSVNLGFVDTTSLACSSFIGAFVNSFCPIAITCGEPALAQTYCYGDSDTETWLYQNSGTESLAILFSGGSIESASFDHLTIHDGDNDTAPVLYDHVGGTAQLANLLVISTGPSLYMEMSSDNSVSCASGGQTQWFWTVGCLDCEQPEAAYSVLLDCANSVFFIATEITALGSDPTITITNTGGAPVLNATAIGTYNVGPFALGADIVVNLEVENALCALHSPVLTSAPCPLIGCGPYQFDLCYPNDMDTTVVYQSPNAYPIALVFNSGSIDAFGVDRIEVYDGTDYLAPLVYSGNNGGDLTDLVFTSTNPDNALCVRFVSDFFDSCEDGSQPGGWNWSVSCLDCTNPQAGFELIEDCLHHGFNVAVNVSSLGSAADLRVTDSWSGDTLIGIGLGTMTIGPIPVGQTAQVTVLNGANPLCRINSEDFTLPQDQCVVTACEPIGVDYCYGDSDTAWFTYQSGENTPVTIAFAYGQLLDGDEVWIYNGLDDNAQLVFAGDFGGDISGFSISSSNPDNALTFQVISDADGSCATGEATTHLYWTVGCGLVGVDESFITSPLLFPQPCSERLNVRWPGGADAQVTAELFDVTGRCVLREAYHAVASGIRTLDIVRLRAGDYVLRLTSAQGVFSGQVLIER